MTDEQHNHDEDDGPAEGTFLYVGLPPEIQAAIDHRRMHLIDNAHASLRFFSDLSEDQLREFRGVLGTISNNPSAVDYFIGVVGGELTHRFGVCLACGQKHDEELEKLTGDGSTVDPEDGSDDTDPSTWSPAEVVAAMAEYGVEPDDGGSAHVMCTNCQKWYENLADRMKRPPGPEGCDGCLQKTKWG